MGPPLDSPKAAAFLDFWGEDIAEKTRFQVCCSFASLALACGPERRHTIAAPPWLAPTLSAFCLPVHS